jgi:hypothetical protein
MYKICTNLPANLVDSCASSMAGLDSRLEVLVAHGLNLLHGFSKFVLLNNLCVWLHLSAAAQVQVIHASERQVNELSNWAEMMSS